MTSKKPDAGDGRWVRNADHSRKEELEKASKQARRNAVAAAMLEVELSPPTPAPTGKRGRPSAAARRFELALKAHNMKRDNPAMPWKGIYACVAEKVSRDGKVVKAETVRKAHDENKRRPEWKEIVAAANVADK